MDQIGKISQRTWRQLRESDRKTTGFETIPCKDLKVGIPQVVSDQVEKVTVFRFGGNDHRLIGYKDGQTFHVVWIDTKLRVYDH